MTSTRTSVCAGVLGLLLAVAASPAAAQDNVWIGAGAGLWIEWGFPASWVLDDVHFPVVVVSSHFRNGVVAAANDSADDLGFEFTFHLEANAGIDLGVGEINVGKAGGWINSNPLCGGRGAGVCFDLNADGFGDVALWEIPGNVDAMIVSSYDFATNEISLTMIEPAPRIAVGEEPPAGSISIPMDQNGVCAPGFTCTPLGTFTFNSLIAIAVPVPNEEFFEIPAGALGAGSPQLRELSRISFTPPPMDAGACCLSNGTCQSVTELSCTMDLSGSFQGPGIACAPIQGCCFSDGTCSNMVPVCCTAAGGVPCGLDNLGNDILCQGDNNGNGLDDACENPSHPIPAISNYGLVALLLLTAVAGVIVIRRVRRGDAPA